MFHLIPIERDICELAAKVGAGQKFKLVDALHFASALEVGCDVFITNDRGIKPASHLKVVQIFE
jgi:predicted nucleic acid-binding protein